MKTQMNNSKVFVLVFLIVFLTGFSAPLKANSGNFKKNSSHEYRSTKGACKPQKTKEYKKSNDYKKFHKKIKQPN
jgi:hypothetical protein